jgi:hypothetical protein
MGRSFQASEIADLQLSAPRLWDKPLDRVIDKFVCRRCGRTCASLKVERIKDGCGNTETVTELARS